MRSARLVDARERLKRHRGVLVPGLVVRAANRERRGARGSVLVEDDDLGAWITEPLQGQQGEQRALAGAGGPDDQGVADVLHAEVEPEGRVAGRAAGDVGIPDARNLTEVGRFLDRLPRRRRRA